MSEFPSIEKLASAQNAVDRDRVIRETWEALVVAVEEWETAPMTAHAAWVVYAARAYVKARKGNE